MKIITINKNECIHYDGMGNRRSIITVDVNISLDYQNYECEFDNKTQYKKWLRDILSANNLKTKQLIKSKDQDICESTEYKSFYTIVADYGVWLVMMIVPAGSPGKARYVESEFKSMSEAINFMRSQPSNHDFEVKVKSNSEVFPMSDDGMVTATLKYSDRLL